MKIWGYRFSQAALLFCAIGSGAKAQIEGDHVAALTTALAVILFVMMSDPESSDG